MNIASLLYLIISVLEIYSEYTGNEYLRFATKPLLIPVLIVYYLLAITKPIKRSDRLLVLAFIFSWFGDIALLFVDYTKGFFLAGLGAFFITHALYATIFSIGSKLPPRAILTTRPMWLLPLAIYFLMIGGWVFPLLPIDMKVPVSAYSLVIATMVLFAINRYGRVPAQSYWLVFMGAILFMVSDSVIAINKFVMSDHLYFSGVWIMLLYLSGQYLIARGLIRGKVA